MTITVKYCGGCNPRYDRVQMVQALRQRFPTFDIGDPHASEADFVLVVCGCPAQCAAHEDLTAPYGKAVVYSEQCFETYMKGLETHGLEINL